MSFAIVNEIKICYEIYGKGEPLILVIGFAGKKEDWIAQIDALSKHFKLVIFDNRGSGKSDRPDEPYTMDNFADDIKGLMDFLGIAKTHICGWSLGGMIVQHFALKYSHRINKIVLINTLGGIPPNPEQGIGMIIKGYIEHYEAKCKDPVKEFFKNARQGFTRNFRKLMERDSKRKFHGIFSAEDLIKKSIIDPCTPKDIINQVNAIGGYNALDRLYNIKNKTFVLCAEKDRLTPQIMNEKIHERLPNSTFKVIKDAGHDSPLEKAPEVNQIIIDFLKD